MKPVAARGLTTALLSKLCLFAVVLALPGAKAQDSRAYANEDVPLSHTLEATRPADAWAEVEKACAHFPALPHSETSGSLAAGDPRTKYIQSWLIAAADKAREFYTKFPTDPRAASAREKELDTLWQAVYETYATNEFPRVFGCATALIEDSRLDKARRFDLCNFILMTGLTRRDFLPATFDVPARLTAVVRILEKDFRDMGNIQAFAALADDSKNESSRPIFREMADIPGMPGLAYRCLLTMTLRQKQAIGEPVAFEFKALDGREVDTAAHRGAVIAVVFWGTSYAPSVTNVLQLGRLYAKYHTNGLDAIGVNVDPDPQKVKAFLSTNGIDWPHYWDGKELQNKLVLAATVTRAGTIILIDKKGILRDFNGASGAERKVQGLLAEP